MACLVTSWLCTGGSIYLGPADLAAASRQWHTYTSWRRLVSQVQPAQHRQAELGFGEALPSLTPAQEELVREALESTAAKRMQPRDPAAVSVDVDMDALTSLINDLREERSECSGASYAKV